MKTISVARLREVLNYDPETGIFTWKSRSGRKCKIGGAAGSITVEGYCAIRIDHVRIQAHRLAIAYVEGAFPSNYVDHRNGVRSDNRYSNLRHATTGQNHQNRALPRHNTSGYMGVTLEGGSRPWVARISRQKETVWLGRFDTPQEAHAAYLAAKKHIHTFQPIPR